MTEAVTNGKRTPLPELGDIFFLVPIFILLFLRPEYLFSDASVARYLVLGNYAIEKHDLLPHIDPISYTVSNKPCFLYGTWLANIIITWLVRVGGFNLLAVAASCFIGLLFLLLYDRCRKEGGHFLLVSLIILLGQLAASVHWLIRGVLFTFFGVYLFYVTLEDFYRNRINAKRLLLVLPFTMLIWVNCHSAFALGLVILFTYWFCTLIEYFFNRARQQDHFELNKLKALSMCLVLTIAVTFLNVYFAEVYIQLFNYSQMNTILAVTDEFMSPIFHGDIQPLCLEILLALFIVGLAITKKPLSLPTLIISLIFAHLSLVSKRNMPLFVIVILPAIAHLFSQTIFSPFDQAAAQFNLLHKTVQAFITKLDLLNTRFTHVEQRCRMHILPMACFVFLSALAISGGNLFGVKILNAGFSEKQVPTKTLLAVQQLKLNPFQGFSLDNWGGYLRYKLGIPVFIDDRAEFYGVPFYMDYGTVVQTLPGWSNVLKKYHIAWILFPNNSTLAFTLKENPDWQLVAKDNAASLFVLNPKQSQH